MNNEAATFTINQRLTTLSDDDVLFDSICNDDIDGKVNFVEHLILKSTKSWSNWSQNAVFCQ